jgi:hypothetical protein
LQAAASRTGGEHVESAAFEQGAVIGQRAFVVVDAENRFGAVRHDLRPAMTIGLIPLRKRLNHQVKRKVMKEKRRLRRKRERAAAAEAVLDQSA